jgi:hypothetical protein
MSGNSWQPIETAPRGMSFLAHMANGHISRAQFINGRFFSAECLGPQGTDTNPTHWMPLPDPPKPDASSALQSAEAS